MARDSKAGTVLAIRDEELGVEGRYFPLGSLPDRENSMY
jgi:hypothetical protein